MLTRAQQILVKRAQAQAGVGDAEYRELLELLTGARSSKDPRLGDAQLDLLLAQFEAIYFRGFDSGERPAPRPNDVFRRRGFWAGRNRKGNTSRDRFTARGLAGELEQLEAALRGHGCGDAYFDAIRRKVGGTGFAYRAALRRTLDSKRKALPAEANPF